MPSVTEQDPCVKAGPATTLLGASGQVPFILWAPQQPPINRELTAQVAICGWVQVGMVHPGGMPQHLPTMLGFFKGDMNQNRPKG